MPKTNSLIAAYILDGKGGGTPIGWNEIKQWTPEQGLLWVHLDLSTRKAVQWINKNPRLNKFISTAMTMDETRPRSIVSAHGLMVILRGVNLNPGQDPEDMVSVRIWIDSECIITTRKHKLLSVGDIQDAITEGCGPTKPSEFLTMLNERLLDRMSSVIDSIDDQVDELEEEVVTAQSHALRPKIADLRRSSITIRRYLAPQREALRRLYHEHIPLIKDEDKIRIREANDRVIRYIEDLDSARERASITQEELASRLSEQLNQRMYMLSVVAVIFLPLSFLTGLLGINVAGIPGATYPKAFALVCALLVLFLVLMLWIFHRKKWI